MEKFEKKEAHPMEKYIGRLVGAGIGTFRLRIQRVQVLLVC